MDPAEGSARDREAIGVTDLLDLRTVLLLLVAVAATAMQEASHPESTRASTTRPQA